MRPPLPVFSVVGALATAISNLRAKRLVAIGGGFAEFFGREVMANPAFPAARQEKIAGRVAR
ncbi:MAG: hypothetical protein M0006_13065 [Magnetospirillum sp.]|nr:hypothetical protein [Magnetospirillum sp.]